jgi:hypothetical protein
MRPARTGPESARLTDREWVHETPLRVDAVAAARLQALAAVVRGRVVLVAHLGFAGAARGRACGRGGAARAHRRSQTTRLTARTIVRARAPEHGAFDARRRVGLAARLSELSDAADRRRSTRLLKAVDRGRGRIRTSIGPGIAVADRAAFCRAIGWCRAAAGRVIRAVQRAARTQRDREEDRDALHRKNRITHAA